MEERRRSQRISVFLEIKEIDRQPLNDTYLLNFSETGAKIETPTEYVSGDSIEFSFVLPDKVTEVSRQARVVWIRPHGNKPGSYLAGVTFTDDWELKKRQRDDG